jgi:hypothetical protein
MRTFGRLYLVGLCIATVAWFACGESLTSIKQQRTRKDLRFTASKLEAYRLVRHSYPIVKSIDDLQQVLQIRWFLRDAWGTPYRYECSSDGQHYRLVSAGKDRAFSRYVIQEKRSPSAAVLSDDIVMADGLLSN